MNSGDWSIDDRGALAPGTLVGVYRIEAAIGALLLYEHSLVKPHDLSRVNAAFFTMNGYVSVLFLVFWAADIFFHASPIR